MDDCAMGAAKFFVANLLIMNIQCLTELM